MYGTGVSGNAHCDLITYLSGPYATTSSTPGPYIDVYGFNALSAGTVVTI